MYGIAMEYLKRTLVRIAYTAEDHMTALPQLHRCICPILAAASHVYALTVEVRKLLYSWGIFQSRRLEVPVISVGNLTWGGNGKTPMTEFLALLFAQTGISPLILTRGYAGGDETKMLQRHLIDTSVKIGSGPNRANVGASFLQQHGVMKVYRKSDLAENIFPFMESFTFANHLCDAIGVIILDDGMQHWSLSRDLEIVMLNCVSLWGNGRMIPRGPLRESLESLRRADIIVLHHADLISDEKHQYIRAGLKDLLKEKIIPTFCSRMVPCYFFRIDCQLSKVPLIAVHNMVVLCVSGIGCPESLSLTMKKLGAAYVDRVDFSDHHSFQDKDLMLIEKKLCDLKDEFGNQVVIVLTEKDYERSDELFSKFKAANILVLHSTLTILCSEDGSSEARFKTVLLEKVIQQ